MNIEKIIMGLIIFPSTTLEVSIQLWLIWAL